MELSASQQTANDAREIIEKYKTTILEYLVVMQSSDALKTMENANYATQFGLSTISHIFKLAYSSTKNAATSALICQKGVYCYIEYIEQMQKINGLSTVSSNQMDYLDAVSFIYDKTLSELYAGSFPGLAKRCGHKEMPILDYIGLISESIIWFQNPAFTALDQTELVDAHLTPFLETFLEIGNRIDQILLFLNTLQEVVKDLGKLEYGEILSQLTKYTRKRAKQGAIDESAILQACLYLKTYLPGITLEKMAALEKWKRPTEDIVKLCF